MNMRKLVNLLHNENYFSMNELLTAIEKMDKKKLMDLIDKPKDEKEMAIPIIKELKTEGYRKKGITRRISVIGFELKTNPTRKAIDAAFSQSIDYLDYCEQVVVAFSPLMYLKYANVIEEKAKKERDMGVWIVGKIGILYRVKEAFSTEISDKKQQSIVEYIEKG